jgi:hypothetical protein
LSCYRTANLREDLMTEPLFWVAVGAFCILASLGLLIRARLEHVASMSWPTTQGRLIQANVTRVAGGDGETTS